MGGGQSRNTDYKNFTPEEKMEILADFKLTYADPHKRELRLTRVDFFDPIKKFTIYSNNYKIKFSYEPVLIDFLCEIGRPFVITDVENIYSINFVYCKNS